MRIVVESKNKYYNRKLSRREYKTIKDAVFHIDAKVLYPDKDSVTVTCLDGDDISITFFRNNKKEKYLVNCLYKMDKYTNRKHFYHAAKLIFHAGRVEIKGLD